ncbi:phosphoribosylanthranilate isomerase [Scheffersomyces stipitis CBS 6054]|uniref:N-(5'-phosphoribosyl)anthranilate isomerase n=1 Tax=Scheffersomyces stipitis (strain ATCC 58785 / CBS 6054 / NBRC 10063 / NRRL Y-11545) TaxID=322104 RepID=A3GFA8_PICST|nr:phosphoribosylanthranilate isomerase [Scheffersomyces stipitis CBS 6054]EAZ63723.2 phosphoribosylanthranilate isomerase [Scheffersomyces stipitis CBS 6054]KAG2731671.1 hypothetical protein G9P44_005258 [Scheffersomyces stipitis]
MPKIVKICGTRTVEAAAKAIESGTDLLGVILVPNRARTIQEPVAVEISALIKKTRKERNRQFQKVAEIHKYLSTKTFVDVNEYLLHLSNIIIENGPFLVGVFRNQAAEEVYETALRLDLDFIQLHGSENKLEYAELNKDSKFGVIPRYVVPKDIDVIKSQLSTFKNRAYVTIPLLDSEAGGEGKVIDWEVVNDLDFGKFILAGGLTPENLSSTSRIQNLLGFDVSGGVEDSNGDKDLQKVEDFIKIGKTL